MDLILYDKVFNGLMSEAKKLGYKPVYTTGHIGINTVSKIIYVKYYIRTFENLYAFCHELGHTRERNHNEELYRKNRLYKIYSEIMAWILGYKYVRKYGLPKVAYFREAIPHLKTYVFYKRKFTNSK